MIRPSSKKTATTTSHFWLDPFVAEVARSVDSKIVQAQTQFKTMTIADRIVHICTEMQCHGIAEIIQPHSVSIWVMSRKMELATGWPDIRLYTSFKQSSRVDQSLVQELKCFVQAVAVQELSDIVNTRIMLFKLCAEGKTEIIGVGADGSFCWAPAQADRITHGDMLAETRRERFLRNSSD